MQESDTYLMILEEGEEKCAREIILGQGEDRFGPPDANVKAQLERITDPGRFSAAAPTPGAAWPWRWTVTAAPSSR